MTAAVECISHGRHHSTRDDQLRLLAAYVALGTVKSAAAALGLRYQTAKNRLSELYCDLDVGSAFEATRALGWLSTPAAYAAETPELQP